MVDVRDFTLVYYKSSQVFGLQEAHKLCDFGLEGLAKSFIAWVPLLTENLPPIVDESVLLYLDKFDLFLCEEPHARRRKPSLDHNIHFRGGWAIEAFDDVRKRRVFLNFWEPVPEAPPKYADQWRLQILQGLELQGKHDFRQRRKLEIGEIRRAHAHRHKE